MRLDILTGYRFVIVAMTTIAIVASYSPATSVVDETSYAWFYHLLPATPTPANRTAIIAIDDKSIEKLGPWPWPRHLLADIISQANKYGARIIALSLPLDTAQPRPSDARLRAALTNKEKTHLAPLLDTLDDDAVLVNQIKKAGNVILMEESTSSSNYENGPAAPEIKVISPRDSDYLALLTPFTSSSSSEISHTAPPLQRFSAVAAGAGLQSPLQGHYQISQPLAVRLSDTNTLVASLALSVAAHARNIPPSDIKVVEGHGIRLGSHILPTDSSLRLYPRINTQQQRMQITRYSAADLINGNISAPQLENKAVFIGLTAARYTRQLHGPANTNMNAAEWDAATVDSILNRDYISVPFWVYGIQRILIICFGALLLVLPRKLRTFSGIWISIVLAIVTINLSLLSLITQQLWLPLTSPAIYLLGAHFLLASHAGISNRYAEIQDKLILAYRELAKHFQNIGQLDQAFEYLYLCGGGQQEQLYELGLNFERRRQFSKAISVYDHIASQKKGYRDIQERLTHLRSLPQALSQHSNGAATATIVVDNATLERPVIGRYQIERELGRGAMGTVYLGKDPKIGRTVAIKTLPLTREFDDTQLAEVRRRFYQEAETAGKLNHPNIVTIYDAGEEHDLAYIAMDFVNGKTLDQYKDPDELLPVHEVFNIGIKIADALNYAHINKVVHRDVKPANVIYDIHSGSLKVTDFGIAYLTDNSKTRSGLVMGSPYYMSPEQIAGRKVDGRSDIFSLGVTLFELFTGHIPFKADSMANLMYRITHENHPNMRKLRSGLPACLVTIIKKALAKSTDDRYKNAAELRDDLLRCKAKL
jgi:CHASE2 domain-containing sensor protein/tRNA A-37 threonylcarbamoyl transferase component Bud32